MVAIKQAMITHEVSEALVDWAVYMLVDGSFNVSHGDITINGNPD
jgi:hypothetical protein